MTIPHLDEGVIRKQVGRRNLHEGREYFQSGALVDRARQGMVLRGECLGSGKKPYRIEAQFDAQGLADAHCSCPVGDHGQCKHVAALLVAWMEHPEEFVERHSWEMMLERCGRKELAAVLSTLLERRPDLQRAVESLLPTSENRNDEELEELAERVPQLVGRIVREEQVAEAVDRLWRIKTEADQFLRQQDVAAAAKAYSAILNSLEAHPQLLWRSQDSLGELGLACLQRLADCFSQSGAEESAREAILRSLWAYYRREVTEGARSPEFELAHFLQQESKPHERKILADWIRAALPQTEARAARAELGVLLESLLGPEMDDLQRRDLYRQTHRVYELVRQLFSEGQVAQALDEAAHADDIELTRIADFLVARQQAPLAETLVRQRADQRPDPLLAHWLTAHQRRQEELSRALMIARELFGIEPTREGFRRVRELARRLGQWDGIRAILFRQLETQGPLELAVGICREEQDIDRALALVASPSETASPSLAAQVARAAERLRPREALELYQQTIERLLRGRDRLQEQEALRYLGRVRTLFRRTGQLKQWDAYRDALGRRHRWLSLS